ncbi:LOW QUALITY PROTEIN: annexin-B12-like [Panulirus ornatus]|uniref:LOW QUALITY PROTEIN: annexin-B12-like n=1 Tax=Panulirus ornatus TaxID=150431 RepID=UPI003A84C0B0
MTTYKGTIMLKEDFNPEKACIRFRKAMKGMGTDAHMVIQQLVNHQNIQRQEIKEMYMSMYGRDLVQDLKDELGGTFEEAVVAMLESPYDLLVGALHDALTSLGTDEKALIDILCCRTPEEIEGLRSYYERRQQHEYSESNNNMSTVSRTGDFKMLMRSLVAAGRDENQTVDSPTAKNDAQILYDSGVGKNNDTDEEEFIRILNTRSFPQLQETFEEYQRLAGAPIEDALSEEFNGDMKNGLLAIVQRVRDPLGFYAERLNQTMVGAGTDDNTLIRILVSRSEVDLADIRTRYQEMYGKELAEDVRDDTQGEYRKLLLAIIGN